MTAEPEPIVRFEVPGRYHKVGVIVRHDYDPLDEVLHDQPTWAWPEILEHARNPTDDEWDTGGNAYDIVINRDCVSIEDQLEELTLATIPHQDFVTIVEGYLAALDRWYAEHDVPTEQRIDLWHPERNPDGRPYHQP